MKQCIKCGQLKELDQFPKRALTKDGHRNECKACYRIRFQRWSKDYATQSKVVPLLKECSQCHQLKPINRFSKRPEAPDGHRNDCLDCTGKRQGKWVKTRAVVSVPDFKQCSKCKQIKSIDHFSKRQDSKDGHRAECISCQDKRQNKWMRNNCLDVLKIHWHNHGVKRRYQDKPSKNHFTASEWQALCQRYDNRCLCCGKQTKLTVDHVVPLKHGGTDTIDNIQPLCHSCNARKKDRTIDYR